MNRIRVAIDVSSICITRLIDQIIEYGPNMGVRGDGSHIETAGDYSVTIANRITEEVQNKTRDKTSSQYCLIHFDKNRLVR